MKAFLRLYYSSKNKEEIAEHRICKIENSRIFGFAVFRSCEHVSLETSAVDCFCLTEDTSI